MYDVPISRRTIGKESKRNFKTISTQIVVLLSFEKGCEYMKVLLMMHFCGFPKLPFNPVWHGIGKQEKCSSLE